MELAWDNASNRTGSSNHEKPHKSNAGQVRSEPVSASGAAVISPVQAVVSPPVQMNADLSATARALFFSLALSTKPTLPPIRQAKLRAFGCHRIPEYQRRLPPCFFQFTFYLVVALLYLCMHSKVVHVAPSADFHRSHQRCHANPTHHAIPMDSMTVVRACCS